MMGPVEEKDLESEEIPFSSSPARRKVQTFDFDNLTMGSHGVAANSWITKKMRMSPFRSIEVVLIKAKINVLLPFGPLAILLHYITKRHVRKVLPIFYFIYLFFFIIFIGICF